MTLTYRKMVPEDLSAAFCVRMSTVENAITMEELKTDYGITPRSLSAAMTTHVSGWICEDSGTVVGFSMGDRLSGEVQVVAVRPEYERRGIGRTLLSRVQEWLFTEGHKEIWLRSNRDPTVRAYGFYRRLGWQTKGKALAEDEILVFSQARNPTRRCSAHG